MAIYWDPNWDDEEWLKKQSAVTLHYLYNRAGRADEGKLDAQRTIIAAVLSQKLDEDVANKGYENINEYESFAYVEHMRNDDSDAKKAKYDEYRQGFAKVLTERLRTLREDYLQEDAEHGKNAYSLRGALDTLKLKVMAATANTLQVNLSKEISSMVEACVGSLSKVRDSVKELAQRVSENKASAEEQTAVEAVMDLHQFPENEQVNRQTIYSLLAKRAGYESAVANDQALSRCVLGNQDNAVYGQDGALAPQYVYCQPLLDKVAYEFPEGTPAEEQARLTKMYNEQLLANAAQRAAQTILKDKDFLRRTESEESIAEYYNQEVRRQFERSVVLAGLATNPATAVLADELKIQKDGHVKYQPASDAREGVEDAIANILQGQAKINPLAVRMDTADLDEETKQIGKELQLKKIDQEKLGFHKKTKMVVKAIADKIFKEGGWKKVAFNAVLFGTSSALMAGSLGAVAAGAAIYAGATAANALAMPVYDTLAQEMQAKGIKGLKNRIKYLKANWKRAKAAKYAEEGFKTRAVIKAAGGAIVGAATFGLGFGGLTGTLQGAITRQGTMAGGKLVSLLHSAANYVKARKISKTERSIQAYKATEQAKNYLKQDSIALGSVLAGAVLGDVIKFHGDFSQETIANAHQIEISTQDTLDRVAKLDSTSYTAPADTLGHIKVPQDTSSIVETPRDSVASVVSPRDTSGVADADTAHVAAAPRDTAEVKAPADTNTVADAPKDSSAIETPKNTGSTVSNSTETVAHQPQVGDEVFRKDHGNGIVETRTLGKNGIAYQKVSGLKGGVSTSDEVQRFYEHRIHNMNQYNKLVEVLPSADGRKMTADEAVNAMLKQIEYGFVELPDGMTPEHAIHTAFMHALYTGDKSAIKALGCPNGEDTITMLSRIANKYSTDMGYIGRPINPDVKLPMQAGTIYVDQPCEVKVYVNENYTVNAQNEIVEAAPTPQAAPVVPETVTEPVDWHLEYGESQYNYPEYQQEVNENTTVALQKYFIPVNGKHPYDYGAQDDISAWKIDYTRKSGLKDMVVTDVNDAKVRLGEDGATYVDFIKKDGTTTSVVVPEGTRITNAVDANVTYSEESGVTPDRYKKGLIELAVEKETTSTQVEYAPHTAQEVADAAGKEFCEPDKLTKTMVFNGTSHFKMFTEDGVVNVKVGADKVPHFTLTDLQGKPTTSVPTELVKEHFEKANELLHKHEYTSNPAKMALNMKMMQGSQGK